MSPPAGADSLASVVPEARSSGDKCTVHVNVSSSSRFCRMQNPKGCQ